MYKIIGADGQEYGPVDVDQLRQWIIGGRANAQTLAQAPGVPEWKPLRAFPEFGDLFGAAAPPAFPPTFDLGACVSRSWKLLNRHFALIVGSTLLVGFILVFVGIALRVGVTLASGVSLTELARTRGLRGLRLQLPGLAASNLWFWTMTGPMIGGLYHLWLKLIRGQPASLADAFAGFGPQFGRLALGSLVVSVLSSIGFCLCLIPGIYVAVAWKFTFPAIIDQRLGFWEGMQASRRAITGHWWSVFALILLTGLITVAGLFACCIGILVSAPVAIGAIAYAYEDLLGTRIAASR